jgi:hypothetical protein
LDIIMTRFQDVICCTGPLTDEEWIKIEGVMSFLRLPRQVMQSLSADARSTLDLVPMTINRLKKLCERGEAALNEIDITLTAATMQSELDRYRAYLVQEPAVIAAYLNPQIPKTTESDELATLKQMFVVFFRDIIRKHLRLYQAKIIWWLQSSPYSVAFWRRRHRLLC